MARAALVEVLAAVLGLVLDRERGTSSGVEVLAGALGLVLVEVLARAVLVKVLGGVEVAGGVTSASR